MNNKSESSLRPSSHSNGNSKALLVVWVLNILVAVLITSYALFLIANHTYSSVLLDQNLKSQEAVRLALIYMVGLFFGVVILAEISYLFNIKQGDIHRCMMYTNNNTMVFTIIFAGLLLNNYKRIIAMRLFVPILDLYVLGRVLFAVGYGLGTYSNYQSFRAVGLGLSLASIVVVGCDILGMDILGFYGNLF